MSVLSKIVVDVEKFLKNTGSDLERFAEAFMKLFGKAPSALQAVENFVGEAAPVVEAAVGLADPVLEAPLAAALATVETGLGAIQASASAAVSGTSLLSALQNFAATVPQLLTGIEIKNPALQAAVEKIVKLVVNEAKVLIPAVESWVKQIEAAAGKAAPAVNAQGSAGVAGAAVANGTANTPTTAAPAAKSGAQAEGVDG